MRTILLTVVAAASLSGGCITAARQVERAIRRSVADPEDSTPRARREPVKLPPAVANSDNIAVRDGHPRLFVGRDWPKAQDDVARGFEATLRKRADSLLNSPPVEHSARNLLVRSREALKRISLLAGVYRFTGDTKYAEAGKRELLNVCSFPDWQPSNMLACSEMMTAASIGYDWLYDTLSAAERKQVVAAIGNFGLNTALDAYDSQGGWTRAQHNWNLVCNGGTIVGALAVAQEDPGLAKKVLPKALQSIRYGLSSYDKNGGTEEGPMYHSYATRYLTFAASALMTATDNRVSLATDGQRYRDWMHAPVYRRAMTGPSGLVANFGDGYESLGNTSWLLWIAGQTNDEEATKFQAAIDREDPSIFDLLWYAAPRGTPLAGRPATSTPGRISTFNSAIVLRSDDSKNFLALRTGGTADHHSHLDLGNFVLDLGGVRFAHDLGADNYGLPGYLGPRRAEYLRSSTPGHNTLTIGEASQPGDAEAKDRPPTGNSDGSSFTIVDITAAYPGAKSVSREASLSNKLATIYNKLSLERSATVVWHLHTPATVTPTKSGATLERDGKRVELKIVEPANAKLTVEPDETRPPQQPVEGSNHVRIKIKGERDVKIVVEFRLLD